MRRHMLDSLSELFKHFTEVFHPFLCSKLGLQCTAGLKNRQVKYDNRSDLTSSTTVRRGVVSLLSTAVEASAPKPHRMHRDAVCMPMGSPW